jgi:hypothetical protein
MSPLTLSPHTTIFSWKPARLIGTLLFLMAAFMAEIARAGEFDAKSGAPTAAGPLCRPKLTLTQIRFSEARDLQRTWTANLAVDSKHCVESSGIFEIKFVRLKEVGPDLLFTERFKWGADMTEVSLDFWWDEAVGDYRIGDITPCGCAD